MEWLVIAILIAIGLGSKANASEKGKPLKPGTKPVQPELPAPGGAGSTASSTGDRFTEMRDRAAKGSSWADDFKAALATLKFPEELIAPVSRALARWAGIESGGNPLDKSKADERGLLQMDKETALRVGVTPSEFASLVDAKTTRAEHARINAKYFVGLLKEANNKVPVLALSPDPLDGVWLAKLDHELPLMVNELRDQRLFGLNRKDSRNLFDRYAPSAKVLTFDPVTPHSAAGVLRRFVIPADVVSDG